MIFMKQYSTIQMQVRLLIFRDFRPFLIHHWIFLEAWHYFASYKKLQSVSSLFKVQVSLILFMFFFPSTSRRRNIRENKSVGKFYINQRPFPLLVFSNLKSCFPVGEFDVTSLSQQMGKFFMEQLFFDTQFWSAKLKAFKIS